MISIVRHAAAVIAVLCLTAWIAGPAGSRLAVAGTSRGSVAVDTGENYYAPTDIVVHAGDTVTWTNSGAEEHTVTPDDESWGTEHLQPGESYSHTFTTPGVYTYACVLHEGQVGTVTVQ